MSDLLATGMTMSWAPIQATPTGDLHAGVDEEEIPAWYKKSERVFKQKMTQEIEAQIDKKWKQKEHNWENEKKKMEEQINGLRNEVLRLRNGNRTTILELCDAWRSHEDKDWLLSHIHKFYEEMKEKYKWNDEVLEELNKLYKQAKSKRNRRIFHSAAVAGGGVFAGAGVTTCLMTVKGMEVVTIGAACTACAIPLAVCAIAGLGVFALFATGGWLHSEIKGRNPMKEENNKKNC